METPVVYLKDTTGKEVFSLRDAKDIANKFNAYYAKFGFRYKVERCGMTRARVRKEVDEGGIIKKRSNILKRRRRGC